MARLTALAFVSLLVLQAGVGRGFGRADLMQVPSPQFTDAEMASALVIMSREGGGSMGYQDPTDLRNAPFYTVGVSGDGMVTFIGSRGVGMIGTLTHKVPIDTVRTLVEAFLRAGFFAFNDSYRFINQGAFSISRTHEMGTTLTLAVGNRSKSVYAYLGIPYAIRELERRVEDATDVRRYTGRPSPPIGLHFISGRVTDDNGAPIQGASIAIAGAISYQATTDTNGRYQASGIFPDDYGLIATADGFVNAVSRTTIKDGSPHLEWNPSLTAHIGPAPLGELLSFLNLSVQATTSSCGRFMLVDNAGQEADVATLQGFLTCASEARRNRTPFHVVVQQRGLTSWVAHGLVGGPGVGQYLYTFDGVACSQPICSPRFYPRQCDRPEVGTDAEGRARITCGLPRASDGK